MLVSFCKQIYVLFFIYLIKSKKKASYFCFFLIYGLFSLSFDWKVLYFIRFMQQNVF